MRKEGWGCLTRANREHGAALPLPAGRAQWGQQDLKGRWDPHLGREGARSVPLAMPTLAKGSAERWGDFCLVTSWEVATRAKGILSGMGTK